MNISTSLKWDGDKVKILGEKVVDGSAFKTGLVVEGNAKLLAPVDTGRLAGSISTQSKDKGSKTGVDTISKPTAEGVVYVGTPVAYGPYMEFGTSKAEAQPFLRPALRMAKGEAVTITKRESKTVFGDYLV